jgi:hypothetical protein
MMRPCAHRVAAAKGVQDLPLGIYVAVEKSSGKIEASFTNAFGEPLPKSAPAWGSIDAYPGDRDTGPCRGAFLVRGAFVAKGYGPLLYDVLMELAASRGLTSDRMKVTADAERVWAYYMKNRPDVRWEQLDIHLPVATSGTNKRLDSLTPDTQDDCDQDNRVYKTQDAMLASPLSKVYYAKGQPTITALEWAGRLIRL